KWQSLILRHCERPRRNILPAERMHFVRQTDSNERATRTLRTVFQRRRDLSADCNETQAIDCIAREGAKLLVERNPNALAAACEVKHPFLAYVAMFLEDH